MALLPFSAVLSSTAVVAAQRKQKNEIIYGVEHSKGSARWVRADKYHGLVHRVKHRLESRPKQQGMVPMGFYYLQVRTVPVGR